MVGYAVNSFISLYSGAGHQWRGLIDIFIGIDPSPNGLRLEEVLQDLGSEVTEMRSEEQLKNLSHEERQAHHRLNQEDNVVRVFSALET